MSTYARIDNGVVAELFTPPAGFGIADCFSSGLVWVVCGAMPDIAPGWTWDGSAFHAPSAPTPSIAQNAAAAMAAGLTVALSGSLTLGATLFPTDPATQIKIASVITALNATEAFPGGSTTYPMKDCAGTWHTFTVAQYKTVAGAIAAYVAALDLIADGNPLEATALPASTVSLSV